MLNSIPLKFWIGGIIGVAFLVTIMAWRSDHQALTTSLEKASSALSDCSANNRTLTASLDVQSAAVRAMEDLAAARQRETDKALADARKATAQAQTHAERILAAKPTEDICASADALILEMIR